MFSPSSEASGLYSDLLGAARKVCEIDAHQRAGEGEGDGGGDGIGFRMAIADLRKVCADIDDMRAVSAEKCRVLEERRSRMCSWCKDTWSFALEMYPHDQGIQHFARAGLASCTHRDGAEVTRMCVPCSIDLGVCTRCGVALTGEGKPKALPEKWASTGKILCEVISREIGYAVVRSSLSPKRIDGRASALYVWKEDWGRFKKCLRCWCPERLERRAKRKTCDEPCEWRYPRCSEGDKYAGRLVTLQFVGGRWEGVRQSKLKRCRDPSRD